MIGSSSIVAALAAAIVSGTCTWHNIGSMRRLQLMYALFCALWAAYIIRGQITFYLTNETATLRGPILCISVFVVVPVVVGYLLLFKAFPWFGRLVRR